MKRPAIIDRSQDERFMREALALAAEGAARGEVPVGAVLVVAGEVADRGLHRPGVDKTPPKVEPQL